VDSKRNFGLDLIRATAILLVVFAHYFASTPLRIGGLLGVELFFVLSGYLIGGILFRSLSNQTISSKSLFVFWNRRWFRTLPNYIFFLGVFTVLAFFNGNLNFKTWLLYPAFLQNIAWPIPNFFGVSWSLSVEEWFYLLFALALFICAKIKPNSARQIELAVLAIFFTIPFILKLIFAGRIDIETMRTIVVFRLDAIMIGVLAAWINMHFRVTWVFLSNPFAFMFSPVLISVGTIMFYGRNPTLAALSFTPISFGVALAIPLLTKWSEFKNLPGRFITYISTVSYSAYLLHMPLFDISEKLLHNSILLSGHLKLVERLVMISATFAAAWIPYVFIEKRFLKLRPSDRPVVYLPTQV
jgi:peptidoglycan/LPS O-acetylase OafA/YrhL